MVRGRMGWCTVIKKSAWPFLFIFSTVRQTGSNVKRNKRHIGGQFAHVSYAQHYTHTRTLQCWLFLAAACPFGPAMYTVCPGRSYFFWLLCMQRAQQAQKREITKQTDAILPLIPTTLWPGHQANFPLSGYTL